MEEKFKTTDDVYAVLGENVVIIPIKWGSKIPKSKGWRELTLEQTKADEYQDKLRGKVNLGVVLGKNSNGLCTVDIDDDDLVAPFLEANPALRETFRTKGKRGENLWFQARGEIPSLSTIKGFGELRGTGGQTVIKGKHPEGMMYHVVNHAHPVSVAVDDLTFPDAVPPPSHSPEPKPVSVNCTYTYMASQVDAGLVARQRTINETEKRVQRWKRKCEDKDLVNAFENYLEDNYEPDFSCRNGILVDLVTNLHGKVCMMLLRSLTEIFHELYKPMFKDPITTHMKEFGSHLRAVERTFLESLPPDEREFYGNLNEREQDAFRICRSLGSCEYPGYPRPFFFLSHGEVARRLLLEDSKTSYRILMKLVRLGAIELRQVGSVWKPGARPKASVWKWALSLPEKIPSLTTCPITR
jgi:hypothetical protein